MMKKISQETRDQIPTVYERSHNIAATARELGATKSIVKGELRKRGALAPSTPQISWEIAHPEEYAQILQEEAAFDTLIANKLCVLQNNKQDIPVEQQINMLAKQCNLQVFLIKSSVLRLRNGVINTLPDREAILKYVEANKSEAHDFNTQQRIKYAEKIRGVLRKTILSAYSIISALSIPIDTDLEKKIDMIATYLNINRDVVKKILMEALPERQNPDNVGRSAEQGATTR
ncbi:MAG: hypothetical protein FWC53_00210 [Firmicutes bacterium]|nr:hypothetical protein [Bacillota bacterium]